jgi:hypothetical protein
MRYHLLVPRSIYNVLLPLTYHRQVCFGPQQAINARSGFKTSPQAQFLCWTEGFNARNIKYISTVESLCPP